MERRRPARCSNETVRAGLKPRRRLFALGVVLAGAIGVVGTSSASVPAPKASGGSSCALPSPTSGWNGDRQAPQVRGQAAHAKLRTLFFLPQGAVWIDPMRAVFSGVVGQEVKIAWGMTGRGRFHVFAVGPDGRRVTAAWGPETHNGGNWVHPGGEWGTGFVLPSAGCWRLHAVRGRRTGNIWIVLQ